MSGPHTAARLALPLALLLAGGCASVRGGEAPTSPAASAASPALGARVRLTLADPPPPRRPDPPGWSRVVDPEPVHIVGTFVRLDTAGVVVAPRGEPEAYFPAAAVARLEVSAGRGPCGRPGRGWRCLAAGLVVGVVAGALVGPPLERLGVEDARQGGAGRRWGAVAGGVFGLYIGGAVARERWERVPGWPPD